MGPAELRRAAADALIESARVVAAQLGVPLADFLGSTACAQLKHEVMLAIRRALDSWEDETPTISASAQHELEAYRAAELLLHPSRRPTAPPPRGPTGTVPSMVPPPSDPPPQWPPNKRRR